MNLLLFLVAGYLQFQAVMLLRSMSADPYLVSTPKLLATADYTDSYTMINSVNALVVSERFFVEPFTAADEPKPSIPGHLKRMTSF